MKSIIKLIIFTVLGLVTNFSGAFTVIDIANRVIELDTNKDGGVSMSEAVTGNATRIKEHFETLDANKDGKVTAEEIKTLYK